MFTASIETDAGTYVHPFHLGTDEKVARSLCEELYHLRKPKQGTVIKTVALLRDRRFVDCYDWKWSSDLGDWDGH